MPSREDWAKKPLREREIAAQAWCDGANYHAGVDNYFVYNTYVRRIFALDLPDLPAPEDLTPYLATAGPAVDVCDHIVDREDNMIHAAKSNEEWAKAVVARARALRAAAMGGDQSERCLVNENDTHLSCGHSKWDSRQDCVTCLQFAVDNLNQRITGMVGMDSLLSTPDVDALQCCPGCRMALVEVPDSDGKLWDCNNPDCYCTTWHLSQLQQISRTRASAAEKAAFEAGFKRGLAEGPQGRGK